jgi:hypothetical protein
MSISVGIPILPNVSVMPPSSRRSVIRQMETHMALLRRRHLHGALFLTLIVAGCSHLRTIGPGECVGVGNGEKIAKADKEAKTLLEWKLCKDDEKEKEKSEKKETKENGEGGKEKKKGNGNEKEKESSDDKAPEEEKRLDTDRPHFPEASTTVGRGRFILESGYTYYASRSTEFQQLQTAPEGLLRIGMFADWFEFRIGENWATQRVPVINSPAVPGGPATISLQRQSGFQDLYLGVKLALTEQEKWLPESALILSTTVPSGASAFTNDAVMPGINYDFSWEVVKDLVSIEGVVEAAGATDNLGHHYTTLSTGLTVVTDLTHNLQNFTEWFGTYAQGALDPGLGGPQHYVVTGFVYFLSNDMEIDIRAGVGLTNHSSNYLAGSGFSIRY